jgi:acyl-homoserine lactone acylase PvdQ
VQKTPKGPVITSAFNYLPEYIKLKKDYILSWEGHKINQEISLFHKISKAQDLKQWCEILNRQSHYAAASFFALDKAGEISLYTNHNHFVAALGQLADSSQGCSKNKNIFTKNILITQLKQNPQKDQNNYNPKTNQKPQSKEDRTAVNHFSPAGEHKRHNHIFAAYLHPSSQERPPLWRSVIFDTVSQKDLTLSRLLKKHLDSAQKRPKAFGKDYFARFAQKNPALLEQSMLALQNWDGNYSKESLAAGIIHRFKISFLRNILYDKLGELLTDEILKLEATTEKLFYSFIQLGQKEPEHAGFDRRRTQRQEIFADIVRLSLYDALFYWKKNISQAVRKWQWGRIHYIKPTHPLAQNLLGRWLFVPAEIQESGHSSALWNMQLKPLNKKRIHAGPSLILHAQKPKQISALMLFGQSGNPASNHYSDLISNWQGRNFLTLKLGARADEKLTLRLKADDSLSIEKF